MTILNRKILTAVSGLALLAGCVTDQQEKPKFVQAVAQEEPKIEVTIAPSAFPSVRQTLKPIEEGDQGDEVESGIEAIKAARVDAQIESAPEGFINATQYFNFEEGALYQLHAASGFLSTIQLQPDETLVNYAAGDTARWIIGDVTRANQTLLLVKPTRPNLTTNLVITTDKRVYLIEAQSHKGNAYNAVIAWRYPFEEVSRQVAVIDRENERRAETVVAGVPIDQLDFDYKIKGDKPSWRPVRAFSDGAKTYIEFPKTLGTAEAPPLFLTDQDGSGQLVNYRVKQNYYIVDRLFDAAELRLGEVVVTINRGGSGGIAGWFKTAAADPRGCKLCRGSDDNGYDDREKDSGGAW